MDRNCKVYNIEVEFDKRDREESFKLSSYNFMLAGTEGTILILK
ncbi:hypothetical protein ACFOG5_04605 [Pedobacter fastidiosus]